jgi:hypothetical protein
MSENQTGFASAEAPATEKKAVAYLNLSVLDRNGNEHRLNTGIPIGGKFEKKLSASILKHLDNPDYTFQLVGRLNSAETKQVEAEF